MHPEVEYAHSGELRIAYQTIGKGPQDLILMPGFVSNIDLAWEDPFMARFLRGLASFSRLVWFDKRGTGLSDPLPTEPSTDDRIADIEAVVDAAGVERATLFGVSEGGSLSLLFARRYPERVSSLILYAAVARLLEAEDFPWGWSEGFFEIFLKGIGVAWSSGHGIQFVNPSLAEDERYRKWFERYLRGSASPAGAVALMRANAALDLRAILDQIRVPTLVLHRVDDPWIPVGQSRYLAERIANATLVELSGIDHWPWIGDQDAVLIEIEAFLTGVRRGRRSRPAWGPDALTHREREVTSLAVQGLSAQEIGHRLFISERTVESHIANTYAKLGISSRVELVRQAAELSI